MTRRDFLSLGLLPAAGNAAAAPIPEPHFPSRLYQFVWRNWELAPLDRMAAVARARPRDLDRLGRSLGLPPKPLLSPEQLRRIYVTTIRQNWHLLPLDQLTRLLGWPRERLDFTLKEDDFLDVKLGPKPDCAPVLYAAPSPAERRRAAEIRALVRRTFGSGLRLAGEPPFAFVARLSATEDDAVAGEVAAPAAGQVSFSGWRVVAEPAVPAGIAAGIERLLRPTGTASADPGEILLRIAAGGAAAAGFTIDVAASRATVTASGAQALWSAFHWMRGEFESAGGPMLPPGSVRRTVNLDPRFLYSYFALYGDPLVETDIDPFPDGYLQKLAAAGVSGVWLQCVLNLMAPSRSFPEFGHRSAERLANLARLAQRAGRAGIRIYLYLNEPRAMPDSFFRDRPEIRGARSRGLYALCTSTPVVRDWISDSLAHVFQRVPDLGGVFSITMSENLTNCFSHSHPETCPRCSRRDRADVVGEVLQAIDSGVRRSAPDAAIMVWDWGWPADLCRALIPRLPAGSRPLSVSEWDTPIERGGVRTRVGEYSLSVVGPGPRARANWDLARAAGFRPMAKVQFNNTWEISAVPYIPAGALVARHCENLLRAGISGAMLSWTLGGYPSPNLEIAREFYLSPGPPAEEVLLRVARRRYGPAAAPEIVACWKQFSRAFERYPYGVAIYTIPTQHGPANLLRARPTGVRSSMILFPQDDYRHWCGAYPPEVVQREFTAMADLWDAALPALRGAVAATSGPRRARAGEELAIAETCGIHFRSVANQMEFYRLRDQPASPPIRARLRALAESEAELARRLYPIARKHSVIAYEASNHYFYRPLDLVEKVVACRYLADRELA